MLKFDTHFYFGTLSKPLGLKGEMILKNMNPDALIDKPIELVFLEINKQLTPFFIEKISFRKAGEAIIKLQDIDVIEKTKEFIKKDVYLEATFLRKQEAGTILFKDLIGFEVIDKRYGNIGKIASILSYPQQEIFEIHFNTKEILLPAVEDFIEDINIKSKEVKINAPAGLIDLYLNSGSSNEEE